MFYVYILFRHRDKKLYYGYTSNFKLRFQEHSKGLNKSTKNRRPLELIYYESFKSDIDARQRERFIKSGKGRELR